MTSSIKPEVHNVSLRRQGRTEPRSQVTSKKIDENRTCSCEAKIADRQTHTQTDRHTQTRSLQYSAPLPGWSNDDQGADRPILLSDEFSDRGNLSA